MSSAKIEAEIEKGNPWYINKQFKWAAYPYIVNIYNGRFYFISSIIKRFCQKRDGSIRLIDLGCGDGVWLYRLSKLHLDNLQLTGLDYNELRINRARALLGETVNFITSDIGEFDNDKYDIVILNHVIEHVQEDEALLRKIRNLVNRNGIIILGTPNEGNRLMQWRNKRNNITLTTDHVHFYTENEIKNKIGNAGFNIVSTYRDPFYIGNDKLFYRILSYKLGYSILKFLCYVVPQYSAGYIFLLKLKDENDQ
jgi:SAM-dependent methyltransferase